MDLDEPMDIDALDYEKFDDLLEEGEYRESNHISRKIVPSVISKPEIKFENKAGTFVTGIDIFSKEVKMKMEERAKRFGLVKESKKSTLSEAENLYKCFGINEENTRNYRLNVIHMRGTENMNTKDIFKYFEDYGPASLEWINDISCNVVWLDKPSAARAILGLSKKIVGIKKEQKVQSGDESNDDSVNDTTMNSKRSKDENAIHVKDIRCPLPPGIWRKGNNHVNSRNIFLRFATIMDKKQVFDEKMTVLQKKDGNRNQGGLKGILTSSRKRKQLKESSPAFKEEPRTNGIAAKNPWGSLSKNWGVTECVEHEYLPKVAVEPVSNVRDRLGFKTQEKDDDVEENSNIIELSDETQSESSSEEEDWCKRSKMPRMRMHADDEEQKIQKRKGKIRNMVNHNTKIMDNNDLRGKLTAKRRRQIPPVVYPEAIQVIVTNPNAVQSNFTEVNVIEDEDEDEGEEIEEVIIQQEDEVNEEEEGEIVEDSGSDSKVEYEEEGVEIEEESAVESENGTSESSDSEKEVQGPKGSVIKVVQHKPKVASTVSTVWSRLNHSKIDTNSDNNSQERYYSKTDLRFTLRKNALRSRIGNHHMRGRSPLRIELRNDKYSGRQNDSE